jgi:hypothetical protein
VLHKSFFVLEMEYKLGIHVLDQVGRKHRESNFYAKVFALPEKSYGSSRSLGSKFDGRQN